LAGDDADASAAMAPAIQKNFVVMVKRSVP
jgi:hypothetical protein